MNPTSRLSSLPVELLRAILEALARSMAECRRRLTKRDTIECHYRDALYPSHVSRRLRHVAFNTPRLWTAIHLLMPRKAVRAFLERSRGALLSIIISYSRFDGDDTVRCNIGDERDFLEELAPFLDIVLKSSGRWEVLAFEFPSWASGWALFKFARTLDLSRLTHVYIHNEGDFTWDRDLAEPRRPYPLDLNLPSLIRLDLIDIWPAPRTISGVSLKDVRIYNQRFSGNTIKDTNFATLFLSTVKMLDFNRERSFDAHRTVYLEWMKSTEEVLTFQILDELKTSFLDLEDDHLYNFKDWKIFGRCRFPQLRSLEMVIREQQAVNLMPKFFHALSLMPALTRLHLQSDQAFPLEDLLDTTVVPLIETVELQYCTVDSRIVSDTVKVVTAWEAILPPRLRRISFDRCDMTAMEHTSIFGLLDAISSLHNRRADEQMPIRVKMEYCREIDQGCLDLWKGQLDGRHIVLEGWAAVPVKGIHSLQSAGHLND